MGRGRPAGSVAVVGMETARLSQGSGAAPWRLLGGEEQKRSPKFPSNETSAGCLCDAAAGKGRVECWSARTAPQGAADAPSGPAELGLCRELQVWWSCGIWGPCPGRKAQEQQCGMGQSPALIPRAWKGNERDLLPITFGHFLVFLPKSHGKFAVLRRAEAVEAACPRCPTGEELGALGFFGEALGKAAGHGWLGSSMDGGRAGRRIPPGAVLLSPVPSPSLRAPGAQLPRQEQGWPRGSRAGGPAGLGATAGAGLLAAPRSALRQ